MAPVLACFWRRREREEDESPHIGGCVLGHRGELGDRWQARAAWNLAACCRGETKEVLLVWVEDEGSETLARTCSGTLHNGSREPAWRRSPPGITQKSSFRRLGWGVDLWWGILDDILTARYV